MDNFELKLNNDTQTEENDVKQLNFFQRIIGIIVSPAETVKSLMEKPRILFPFILIAVVVMILLLLNFGIYKDSLRITSAATYERMNIKMTSEQLDQTSNLNSIIGLVTTPITSIIILVLGTLILFGLIKAFKGEGQYKQFLSITSFAYVILLLGQIVAALVSYMTGNYSTVPATNLSVLLPDNLKGSFLYGFVSGIELFSLWNYFVVSIGVLFVSKLSKTKVYTVIGIIYGASLLLGGLFETMNGLFK